MHAWHEEAGAVFEDVGQWKRPFYYPQSGENKRTAVARESLAVRNAVGIMDVTTLGKILICGPDSVEFLNRVYTNAWDSLAVGRCRYGLMLGEDGMVLDDGVTAHLSPNRFLMTTTTGNAARVLSWLEDWLQTEWPDLDVYLASLTEQFATIALAGPGARQVLAGLVDDIDVAPAAFPFRPGAPVVLPACRRGCSGSAIQARWPTRSVCPPGMAWTSGWRCCSSAPATRSRRSEPKPCTCSGPKKVIP